jgi:hypothetical protein
LLVTLEATRPSAPATPAAQPDERAWLDDHGLI